MYKRQLVDLAAQSSEFTATAQRHLLDVYEAQRDWSAAVAIAEALIASAESEGQSAAGQGQPAPQLRGHYLCEQAEAAVASGDQAAARALYEQALRDRPRDLRALMGLVRCALEAGDATLAMEYFHRVMDSERRCTPEMLDLLRTICAAQVDPSLYMTSLERYYDQQHSPLLALALAAELSLLEGREPADDFLRGSVSYTHLTLPTTPYV